MADFGVPGGRVPVPDFIGGQPYTDVCPGLLLSVFRYIEEDLEGSTVALRGREFYFHTVPFLI